MEEIKDGPLAGKMALYAGILPTSLLVELVKKGQKLFTLMEVNTKFADTGKAYLVGLAATDDPASLGTEMLQFSASASKKNLANRKQHPDNLFTAAAETLIELEEVPEAKPALFKRIQQMFSKQQQIDDARFSDVHQAVELIATEQQNKVQPMTRPSASRLSALVLWRHSCKKTLAAFAEQQTEFNELKAQLSHEDDRKDFRQRAPGANGFFWPAHRKVTEECGMQKNSAAIWTTANKKATLARWLNCMILITKSGGPCWV